MSESSLGRFTARAMLHRKHKHIPQDHAFRHLPGEPSLQEHVVIPLTRCYGLSGPNCAKWPVVSVSRQKGGMDFLQPVDNIVPKAFGEGKELVGLCNRYTAGTLILDDVPFLPADVKVLGIVRP